MSSFFVHEIQDISLPINEKTPIYPGNPEVNFETVGSQSGTSFLTRLQLGTHTGTHVDAPSHVDPDGKTLDQIPLSNFIGLCQVVDLTRAGKSISVANLKAQKINKNERLLLKTQNSLRGFAKFYEDFVYLTPEGAKYLADREPLLVGIDAWSVKQKGEKDNIAHTALLSKNIPILEAIDLKPVLGGYYFLIVLPLKFTGLDGSPARAVLLR